MSDKQNEEIEKAKAEAEAKKAAAKAEAEAAAKAEAEAAGKVKAELAAKAEAEAAEKVKAELAAKAEAEAARIMASDEGANTVDEEESQMPEFADGHQREQAMAAVNKLRLIAQSYPVTTPDSHTLFGFGGHIFTIGELRYAVGIHR